MYIKYLPKDALLYALWCKAKTAPILYHYKNYKPVLTIETVQADLNAMIKNNRPMQLSVYHGKYLYVDLTNETFDSVMYNSYNGWRQAEKIVSELKLQQLQKMILTYHTK